MKFNYPLLISNPTNIFYLTGISIEARDGWVLATKDNIHFFTDSRYSNILTRRNRNILMHEISSSHTLTDWIKEIIGKAKETKLYYEADNLTVNEMKVLKRKLGMLLKPTVQEIAKPREVKSEKEVVAIKRACEVIDACLHEAKYFIEIGKTEYEIALYIDSWLRQRGYSSAFDPIVAINEHAAVPHFNTLRDGTSRVAKNCIILIDVGARVAGYCSDITRMFVIGDPGTAFTTCYNNMLEIQEKTIQALGSSKTYADVDNFCREELKKVGIIPHTHATGHGIGIEVHEKPYIGAQSKEKIVPGHVVTIEPGTYIDKKFGIRIEDTVYIDKNNQPAKLTNFPKNIQQFCL